MKKNNIKISDKAAESMNNEQLLYCNAELYNGLSNPKDYGYDIYIIDDYFEDSGWPSFKDLASYEVHRALTLIKPSVRKNCLIYLHEHIKDINYYIGSADKHCNIMLNSDFEGVNFVLASEIKDLPDNSVVFTHDEFAKILYSIKFELNTTK